MALFSKLKNQIISESIKSKIPENLSEVEREMIFGKLLENSPFKGKDGGLYIKTDGGHIVKVDRDYFDKEEPKAVEKKEEGKK